MPATRIIPASDDGDFPYDAMKTALEQLDGVTIETADLTDMIATGKRAGWTPEMVEANEALQRRGNCRSIKQTRPPYLLATLFEDNLYVMYTDAAHRRDCAPLIRRLADALGLRVWHQESPFFVKSAP